jgi:hypothetical protein
LLFGGSGANTAPLGDTWEYDGANWSPVATATAPSARSNHALAYDSARGRAVLFGGRTATSTLGDTWEFDGSRWQSVGTAQAPAARSDHALAYDTARELTVLFGGGSSAGYFADTWEYDGSNWTMVPTPASPSMRTGHALVYDVVRGRTVMFGGIWSAFFNEDTWEYDGSTWTRVATREAPARRVAPAAYDLQSGRMVVFAGYAPSEAADTWELLPLPAASFVRHGRGCPGSAGTPVLDTAPGVQPTLGSVFPLQLTSLPAGGGIALLGFGFDLARWNGAVLPQALDPFGLPGCRVWVGIDSAMLVVLVHAGNAVTFPLAIPANPALAGLIVGAQALVLDAAASSGIAALTNGAILTVD